MHPKGSLAPEHTNMLQVKLLHPLARAPRRATSGSAGYDLYAVETVNIPAMGDTSPKREHAYVVRTGVAIRIPEGHYGRIAPRSGLSLRYGMSVNAGVIDRDYVGEVMVMLVPSALYADRVSIQAGHAVAQLVLEKIGTPDVDVVKDFAGTEHQDVHLGFGSTGL